MPPGFSWIVPDKIAGLAYPSSSDDFHWLRRNGIQLLISLTEDPPRRDWINEAGLMSVHVPVPDMTAPTVRQLEHILDTVRKANASDFGVGIHCAAGRGRTGTVLAAYLIHQGVNTQEAIRQIRQIRPGSIETAEQEQILEEWQRHLRK